MTTPTKKTIMAMFLLTLLVSGAQGQLLVVYPEANEPFRSVFEQIVSGVEKQATIERFVLRGAEQETLAARVSAKRPVAIVALGTRAVNAVQSIADRPPLIAGAVLTLPESKSVSAPLAGISLTPDPVLLFARLRELMPRVKRVTVLYNPVQNDWLVRLARDAAVAQGLDLDARPVTDLREAVQRYREVFARIKGPTQAIWLPLDGIAAEEATVLPLVLEYSWKQDVALFSSSLAHVQRGALFSLYPDHAALGRRLALMADEHAVTGLVPLRDVRLAVNLRAASHLGLDLAGERRRFDLVFPES